MEPLIQKDTIEQIIAAYKHRMQRAKQKNRLTQPFQVFALEVADKLNDRKNIGMYMRLAKNKPRTHIERALSFVLDSGAQSKVKLFLWKIKQIRLEMEKQKEGRSEI